MKVYLKFLGITLTSYVFCYSAFADNFNAAQQADIEKIVHQYIVKNPQVLVEASQALQQQQAKNMEKMEKEAQQNIAQNPKALLADANSPVAGNPKGSVTLVEFFDYQCGHCRHMGPVIDQLIKNNKELRVVYKELPIFGGSSQTASLAALAAAKQGKYEAFHNALLTTDEKISDKTIYGIAEKIGLNMDTFNNDMQSDSLNHALDDNKKLAAKLNIMGTPAFIVAKTNYDGKGEAFFVPGAAPVEVLQNMINKLK